MYPLRALYLLAVIALHGCAPTASGVTDREALRSIHRQVLEAHLARDAEAWTALEADTVLVGNRGSVFPSARADRLAMRRRYFLGTRFSVYRDVQAPIIQVSRDGSQAWLMANVEVVAHPVAAVPVDSTHTVWAWVELYEKRNGRWAMVGNVSNERPGTAAHLKG